jgi:hypothetical protein
LEAVEISTDELRKIHEDYIEATNIQASAFLLIVTAIENQNSGLINEAKLAKEHDVKLEKGKD